MLYRGNFDCFSNSVIGHSNIMSYTFCTIEKKVEHSTGRQNADPKPKMFLQLIEFGLSIIRIRINKNVLVFNRIFLINLIILSFKKKVRLGKMIWIPPDPDQKTPVSTVD